MDNANIITNLQNCFLVATPQLDGSAFEKSIIYICNHNDDGAMGLMVNSPIDEISFSDIVNSMGIIKPLDSIADPIIYSGGPVDSNRGFVIHSHEYFHESTIQVSSDIFLSASAEIVSAIARDEGPKDVNFCLGYAGWSPGQLENEIATNGWLVVPADADILFNTPAEERFEACMSKMGFAHAMHWAENAGLA